MSLRSHRLFGGHALAIPHPALPRIAPPARRTGTWERTLLDLVMPDYHFRGGAKVSIEATPEEVLGALEEVALAEMPIAHGIRALRYLSGHVPGRQRLPGVQLTRPFIDVTTPFLRLGEDPGREVVIGLAGAFHNLLDPQFVDLPDLFTFTRFNDAGFQKLAIGFRAVGDPDGIHTTLTTDHRTLALSRSSRRKFALSWYLLVGWGGNVMLRRLLNAVKRHAEAEHHAGARP